MAKTANTATTMAAALVTTPAAARMPAGTARAVARPASRAARIRETTNMWQSMDTPNKITNRNSGIQDSIAPGASRPSPVITAAPVLSFFSTNYMDTGCVATPSTRAVNGGVMREKDEESAGHPPAMRRPRCEARRKAPAHDVVR